jgi:hypothetical protein
LRLLAVALDDARPMFVDAADPELTAAEAAAGEELSRGMVTGHGFSLLWVNGAVDTQVDPLETVERIAWMLFDG